MMRCGCGWVCLWGGGGGLRLGRVGGVLRGGEWRFEIAPAGAVSAQECLRCIEVSGLDEGGLRTCIGEAADVAAKRLSPEQGRLLQAVWFDAGNTAGGRLLLSIHHLAVDGVSWRILIPDLAASWEARVA